MGKTSELGDLKACKMKVPNEILTFSNVYEVSLVSDCLWDHPPTSG